MKIISFVLLFHLNNGEKGRVPLPISKEKPSNNNEEEGIRRPSPGEHVYMGPTFYESLIDPSSGLKEPVDFLEMRMVYPQTEEEKRYYLKHYLKDIQFYRRLNPYKSAEDKLDNFDINSTRKDLLMHFDFEALQARNLDQPPAPPPIKPITDNPKPKSQDFKETMLFNSNTFAFDEIKINWTTCDEFKRKSVFHPKDLLNIDWVPFYIWSFEDKDVSIVHKFSVPTLKTVKEFKEEYGPYLSENVDWTQPKLLMEEDIATLLIAADRRGLFHGIRDHKVSDHFKKHPETRYPVLTLRLKIVDPYLAMMYCNDYFAQIMAISGQVPQTNELKTSEAKVLNFTGKGYPVSRDFEMEKEMAEWKKRKALNDEPKFIDLTDEYRAIQKDHYMEMWK